ncbi:hypothetical protein LRR80_06752 [Streptomyces sp. RO-S4]|nr:hypothetical protein [Streptomyces sp. RO-S4]
MRGVRGRRRRELGQRTRLGDALVDELSVLRLPVPQQLAGVDRFVALPLGRVDARRREQGLHAEGAGLVRDDRHPAVPRFLVPHQVLDEPDQRHGGRHLLLAEALPQRLEGARRRLRQGPRHDPALRGRSAQGGAPFAQVTHLGGVLARVPQRHLVAVQRTVRDRQVQPVAQLAELRRGQLLHLVVGVARGEVGAQRVPLHRLHEDHGGCSPVPDRPAVGGVHLERFVPAARRAEQVGQPVVVETGRDAGEGGAGEEVLADVGGVPRRVRLQLGVRHLAEPAHHGPVGVLPEQRVPGLAPQRLDHVPARPAEPGLQLPHDLGVGPHRAVQLLQVAVDDEGEVVQPFAGRERQGRGRLGLVHLAVAEERPHPGGGGVLDTPVVQIAVEPGLVDRCEGAEAHGHGRELPQPRQPPGMRIGRQPVAVGLTPEARQVPFVEAPFEEDAGVDTGRRVSLQEQLVAGAVAVLAAEEVVEPDLVQPRRGGVRGDVAAEAQCGAAAHHRRRVPPVPRGDPGLQGEVAGEVRLRPRGDGVDVVRGQQAGHGQPRPGGVFVHAAQQVHGPVGTRVPYDRVEGRPPLGGLLGVTVGQLVELARRGGLREPERVTHGAFPSSHTGAGRGGHAPGRPVVPAGCPARRPRPLTPRTTGPRPPL